MKLVIPEHTPYGDAQGPRIQCKQDQNKPKTAWEKHPMHIKRKLRISNYDNTITYKLKRIDAISSSITDLGIIAGTSHTIVDDLPIGSYNFEIEAEGEGAVEAPLKEEEPVRQAPKQTHSQPHSITNGPGKYFQTH